MVRQLHDTACMLVTCLFVKGLWRNIEFDRNPWTLILTSQCLTRLCITFEIVCNIFALDSSNKSINLIENYFPTFFTCLWQVDHHHKKWIC